jgi:peroxiredoxin
LKEIRAKVSRTAKKLGINYTVLMDESNEVGGRFNGGELPTTVLVDPQGNVRRRFVGARALPVFEAMLAEITQPQFSSAVPHP